MEDKEKVNGNMANNMEELKMLGKEMEKMHEEHGTNGQNGTKDPIQFDEDHQEL